MMIKNISIFLINLLMASLLLFSLTACRHRQDPQQIRLGTISGPETELMQIAQQVALRNSGLRINIIEFSDYSLPNIALNEASLDANMFQHQHFLENEMHNRGYHLVVNAKDQDDPRFINLIKAIHAKRGVSGRRKIISWRSNPCLEID